MRTRIRRIETSAEVPLRARPVHRCRAVGTCPVTDPPIATRHHAAAGNQQRPAPGIAYDEIAAIGPLRAAAGDGDRARRTRLVTDNAAVAARHQGAVGNRERPASRLAYIKRTGIRPRRACPSTDAEPLEPTAYPIQPAPLDTAPPLEMASAPVPEPPT